MPDPAPSSQPERPPELVVTARFVCTPRSLDEARTILAELARATRAEPGCLAYGYFEQADAPGHFTSIERWASSEAEAAHWRTAHLESALHRLGPLMAGEAELRRYVPLAER